jgi:threonyl-tRNA synthetase
MMVVGRREADEGKVALRRLGGKNQEVLALDDAIRRLSVEAQMPSSG